MTLFRFLLRSLFFHWRGNLAVLLGVVVGCAVLSGALLVGDSLQGSLRDRALARLGWVQQAVVAPRFFGADLAERIAKASSARVAPAIMLQATVTTGEGTTMRQVRGVTILGVDASFFAPDDPPEEFIPGQPTKPACHVNAALAQTMEIEPGAKITLRLQKPSALPREAVLARKDVNFDDLEVPVARVLSGDEAGNHFSLRPGLDEPRNALVPLALLQQKLDLAGQVNALLFAGDTAALRSALQSEVRLEDRGLVLHTPRTRAKALLARYDRNRDGVLRGAEWFRRGEEGKRKPRFASIIANRIDQARPDVITLPEIERYYERQHPYLALESKQLLLPPAVANRALAAAKDGDFEAAATAVYLCRLSAGKERIAGVVAAVEPERKVPLGPFLPTGKDRLEKGEIVLVDEGWPGEKRPAVGEKITLTFKPPESHGQEPDLHETFRLAGYIPMAGVTADPSLTPEFPGITDKDDLGDWTLPFNDPNWQQQTIRKEYTEAYWDRSRAAPKAYVTLSVGLQMWSSRFGTLTGIRLAPRSGEPLQAAAERYAGLLRKNLPPEETGFVLDEVQKSSLDASAGSTPFGVLFLSFSFFLILSALMLVGLLYRLNLDRRAREVGVIFATGFPLSTTRGLLLGEGGLIALGGVVLGSIAALWYSRMLVQLLAALWPGGVLQSFLTPHATPLSLLYGGAGALAVSVLTIGWVARALSKVPPRALLSGQTTAETDPEFKPASWRVKAGLIAAPLLGVLLLVVGPYVPGHEAQAGTFFGSGALFLTAGLLALYLWMKRARHRPVEGSGMWNIARLGVRNAARHPARSLLTVGLLASAAFLLVAVESFRRRAEEGDGRINASDGGFSLVAETDLPIIRDFSTPAGRQELLDSLRLRLTGSGMAPKDADKEAATASALLEKTTIIGLRARAGDDASCLNLYQPRSPRVLGVPAALIERGGFVFDSSLAKTAEEKANPWLLLRDSKGPFPAFGEANTVAWILKSGLGQEVKVPDERGEGADLRIAGLLHDSVFQSSLLVSEDVFLKLYPGQEGYNYLLIAPPAGREGEVRRLLEQALADRGIEVTPTAEKVAAYLAVENTYLTTFQALGGLGLVLGSLGLAVVLLRAVWERRAELALLRALGWRRLELGWLVLAENSFLLLVGLVTGTVAALLSILPQLLHGAGTVPVANLLLLFAGVLVVALLAGLGAVAGTLRAPIVEALRRE